MSNTRDDKWLLLAERIDALRIIPRILCFGYGIMYAFAFFWLVKWAMAYDYNGLKDPAMALAIVGMPTAILGMLGGFVAGMTKDYWRGGRKWNSKMGDTE